MRSNEVKIGQIAVGGENEPKVMGVINLSPESFYQQSVEKDETHLIRRVEEMIKEQVAIIDVGGASTAPKEIYGTSKVEIEKESKRIAQGLEVIKSVTDIPVSIDTTSAEVVEVALDYGIDIVNDVSGFQGDPRMAKLVAEYDVPVVLMANPSTGKQSLANTLNQIKRSLEIATRENVDSGKIIIDPGIGFGKPMDFDITLLKNLDTFKMLGHPLLVGVSRKAFIGTILDQPDPEERLIGTIAATSIAVANGADVIRAHDVLEAFQASKIGFGMRHQTTISHNDAQILEIHDKYKAKILLEYVGTGKGIIKALAKKMIHISIHIRQVSIPGALILKQEMLALGGDAAYHHDTIDSKIDRTDVILMGTLLHMKKLAGKIKKMRYFGLEKIGSSIQTLLEIRNL
ncbi:MAG: dihydropteroate synthase [Candidatus Lokiarchaeota archaeon]|nr:dihydropteroate synthase [Candidatus Lokiarchaeota archaeon]